MHFPVHTQWWSSSNMHMLQSSQCSAFIVLGVKHFSQDNFVFYSLSMSLVLSTGTGSIPGLTRNVQKYANNKANKIVLKINFSQNSNWVLNGIYIIKLIPTRKENPKRNTHQWGPIANKYSLVLNFPKT